MAMEVSTSPSSSPTSSVYLPGFLLGENEVSEEMRSRVAGREELSTTPPRYGGAFSPLRADYNRGSKLRLNGPPIQGLFDENETSSSKLNTSSFLSPSWMNKTGEGSGREQDGHWVVVFGFPPSAASHILNIFSQCGRVIEHNYPTNGGNWLMLRYEDKIGARKALGYNTRVVAGNIMLGVAERSRIPELRQSEGETSLNASGIMSPRSPRVRHLGPPKQTSVHTPTDPQAPKRDTSVVTRAMDLIFGW